MQLRCNIDELRLFRYSLVSVRILFRLKVGGWVDEWVGRLRLTSAKVIVEVEDELGNYGDFHASNFLFTHFVCPKLFS